jgi:tetratricopeptide (TPR) repeat protein
MIRKLFSVSLITAFALLTLALSTPAQVKTFATAEASTGKIPVSTASSEARAEYALGQSLQDKLLIQDSIQHFDKAIALDPNFALAELNRANTSPTAKEFFEHLKKAVALSEKASPGERLLILATEAGANGNPAKQKEYLDQLVSEYPNDERAQFNLGGYHFGQQEFPQAIQHYKKATELNPGFSNAFNLLGYAYRQNEDYPNAEEAFKKYIDLIPNDPNPYDSYAELLLKMGRFDDSIRQYSKALAVKPNFINSHFGIAANLMYQGKTNLAIIELQRIMRKARSDAERRTALFGKTVVFADSGDLARALIEVDQQYALGEKTGDVPARAGDLQLKGNILLEMGRYAEAAESFSRALAMTEASNLSDQIKNNTRRFDHFNRARVALGKKDMATAKSEAKEFWKAAEASKNPAQIKLAHELAGMVALEAKDTNRAIELLQKANLQNPYNLYRLCVAYREQGDMAKATDFCRKAATINTLPQINSAFVRAKARKLIASSKG